MPKLTKTIVDGFEPRSSDYFEWDSDPTGFGVRVWPTGKKVYLVQYRVGKATKRLKIGVHGTLTLDQAKKQARVLLGEVAKGEDPAAEKATRRKSMTVGDLCDRYLAATDGDLILGKGGLPKKASTIATDRGRISRHILPLLGKKLVRDLEPADIHRFIRDVTAGKTATVVKTGLRGKAVVEGGAGAATRTTGLLGGILTFAVTEGIIKVNPVTGVKRPAGKKRKRRLTDEEFRTLGQTLWKARDSGLIANRVMSALLLIAITGCRFGEIERLKWSDVDQVNRCFRLSDSKEGASTRPIAPAVFGTLNSAMPRNGSEWVMPGKRSGKHYCGLRAAWNRITLEAGFVGVTPHTLRHSFASVANDLGYSMPTISALLGHAAASQTADYVHCVDAALVDAAAKVTKHISDLLFWKQRPHGNGGDEIKDVELQRLMAQHEVEHRNGVFPLEVQA